MPTPTTGRATKQRAALMTGVAHTTLKCHMPGAEFINLPRRGLSRMKKYRCIPCGYIYDPAKGDPDSNIPPGTSFESLPDDWHCPICFVSKDDFEPIDD